MAETKTSPQKKKNKAVSDYDILTNGIDKVLKGRTVEEAKYAIQYIENIVIPSCVFN